MSHTYAITTDGTDITITLMRNRRILTSISGKPEVAWYDLTTTVEGWTVHYGATPAPMDPRTSWDRLPPQFRHLRDELLGALDAVA